MIASSIRYAGLAAALVVALLSGCGDEAGEPLRVSDLQIAPLSDLESFRYSIKLRVDIPRLEEELMPGFADLLSQVEINGASQPPDRMEWQMRFGDSREDVKAVIIGDRAWFYSGGAWAETPDSPLDLALLTPERISDDVTAGRTFGEPSRESLRAMTALHYSAAETDFDLLAFLGVEASETEFSGKTKIDLWLTEDGLYPIKIAVDAAGKDGAGNAVSVKLEMDLTNLDDPSIQIEAPVP